MRAPRVRFASHEVRDQVSARRHEPVEEDDDERKERERAHERNQESRATDEEIRDRVHVLKTTLYRLPAAAKTGNGTCRRASLGFALA